MPSAAKGNFELHIRECDEALEIYQYLERNTHYSATFGLRFVWIAAVSSLDHYITELVIERASARFASGALQTMKMQNEKISLAHGFSFVGTGPIDALLVFRNALSEAVRFKSFQSAKAVADGLAYIWDEQHKWQQIGGHLRLDPKDTMEKLDNICARRNLIAHNADIEEATGKRLDATLPDAVEVVNFIRLLVGAIDDLAV